MTTVARADYTVFPDFGQDDIVITNSDGNYGGERNVDYEFYDASSGTFDVYRQADGDTWQEVTDNYQNQGTTGTPTAGGPFFPQSVEFDNAGGSSHNPNGNLLAVNFGNSYTGFELYTISTDGNGDSWSSVWSAHCEAGGEYGSQSGPRYDASLSQRGGGLGVSPFNDKLSWLSYDTGELWVLDYYDGGTAAGTGTAQWGQTPTKDAGAWAGNPRQSAAIGGGQVGKTGATQGTTWLNQNTVAVYNAFGEIVTVDVSQVAGGTNAVDGSGGRTDETTGVNMAPTQFGGWSIDRSGIGSGNSQYTDIEYNPEVDPTHIYMSETRNSGYDGWLYRVDYDPSTGTIGSTVESWDLPDSDASHMTEPREIAFDSQGNLWLSGYRNPPPSTDSGFAVVSITDVVNSFGNDAAVNFELLGDHYGAYSGIDVANDLDVLYDIDCDGVVGGSDLNKLLAEYGNSVHQDGDGFTVDLDGDGEVGGSDLNKLLADYGKSYVGAPIAVAAVAVPEPGTLSLLALLGCPLAFRRRR